MGIPWYIYAFSAAIIWGVHYLLLNRALSVISPVTAYWLPTIIMVLGIPLFYKQLQADYQAVMQAEPEIKLAVSTIMFTSFAASICLYKAIQMHYNPVHVSLIEVTYPIFIAIFALIFFSQNHLNLPTMFGGLLILTGTSIVIRYGS